MPAPVAPGGPRPTRRYVALMAAIVWVFGLLLFISAFMLPGNYYGFIAFGVDTAVCLFAILALTSHHLVHTLLVATVVAAATAIGVAGLIANSITTVDCDGAVEDRPSVCEYRRVVSTNCFFFVSCCCDRSGCLAWHTRSPAVGVGYEWVGCLVGNKADGFGRCVGLGGGAICAVLAGSFFVVFWM